MKWISHSIIAAATCAVVNPVLVPVAILGGTAPDWIEPLANRFLGQKFTHRKETHYVTTWVLACLFFGLFYDYLNIGLAFSYGGLTHVLCDSLTVSGIHFSPFSNKRFHLVGGRLVNGSAGEYIIALSILFICVLFVYTFGLQFSTGTTAENGFLPFFFEWWNYYDAGLIDGAEWRANRFKFL
jgi:inner membrane protein